MINWAPGCENECVNASECCKWSACQIVKQHLKPHNFCNSLNLTPMPNSCSDWSSVRSCESRQSLSFSFFHSPHSCFSHFSCEQQCATSMLPGVQKGTLLSSFVSLCQDYKDTKKIESLERDRRRSQKDSMTAVFSPLSNVSIQNW